jgi:hypothetical protein
MRRLTIVCVALSILGFLFVPVEAKARKAITSFKKLGANETVVVGRVELVPPLHEHEQRVRGPMSKRYRNTMFLIIDDEYRELTEEPGWGDFKGRIDAPFGEEFAVRSKAEPFYVIAGMMVLTMGHGPTIDNAYFPGGLKADIRPDDRAVYVGTIRYQRDEFFEVTGAEIVDDYARVRAEFEARFGKQHPLRKALLRPVE